MLSSVDLLDQPYIFSQRKLLSPDGFAKAAKERGGPNLHFTDFEGFHRLGLLVPFLRVQRDGRAIAGLARSRSADAWHLSEIEHTETWDLLRLREEQRLRDPAIEAFRAARWRYRTTGEIEYRPSQYLYSSWQLMGLEPLRAAVSHLTYEEGQDDVRYVTGIRTNRFFLGWAHRIAGQAKADAVVCSLLEPFYYPEVTGRLSLGFSEEFASYQRWAADYKPLSILRLAGVKADYFKERAVSLLAHADRVDPIAKWISLVREMDSDQWESLEGDARVALEMRTAAEMHLRYYERLVKARRARPLPKAPGRWRGEFHSRLKRQGNLDKVLTRFGLSPHPSLVMVVEGETEMLILPRLMELFGIRTDEDFISIQNREGVTKDIRSLLAYAVAPRIAKEPGSDHLDLNRPLTRVLIVSDPEGPMATSEQREERRLDWVKRLERTLPRQMITPSVRTSLDRLVFVDVWNARDENFEFAHFTDRQIAQAIDEADRRERRLTVDQLIPQVKRCRDTKSNLQSVLGRTPKGRMAEALWPTLETKVKRAQERGTAEKIPAVKIIDRATDLAREIPRRNVVIPMGGT